MKNYSPQVIAILLAAASFLHAEPFPINFVTVGDAGNVADSVTKLGAVAAPYQIGKYEVTVAQYCAFLNAVAVKGDPHGLYNPSMAMNPISSIRRTINDDGTFQYTILPNADQLPITCVRYNSTLRFCNWYQGGMPTSAAGDAVVAASTEEGAYTFSTLEDGSEQVALSTNAIYTLATEDQWVKAAYYAGSGTSSSYYLYPTKHNNAPNIGATDVTNEANWDTTSYASFWTGLEARKNPVLTAVDFYAQTMSAYQVCDMGGNVNEWMMHPNETDPASPLPITRGGSWASTYFAPNHWARATNDLMRTAPATVYDLDAPFATQGSNQIGFRLVCSVVPPERTVADTSKNGAGTSNNSSLEQSSNQRTWGQWWNGLTWYEKAGIVVGGTAVIIGGSLAATSFFFPTEFSAFLDCVDGYVTRNFSRKVDDLTATELMLVKQGFTADEIRNLTYQELGNATNLLRSDKLFSNNLYDYKEDTTLTEAQKKFITLLLRAERWTAL